MAGEASIQELAELEELMHENAEWKKFAEQLTVNQPETAGQVEHEADAAFAAHIVKMQLAGRLPAKMVTVQGHGKRNLLKWTMRIAAVLMIAVAGLYTFRWLGKNNKTDIATSEVITVKGSRSRTQLIDGTTLWLNADSKLTYAGNFGKKNREVSLTGEAFFDVVKQTNRPFIVHTSNIDIVVLGTAFNVKSYPNDKNIEITLYRGLVQVIRMEGSARNAIQLKPNQKLILAKQETNETLRRSEDKRYLHKEIPSPIITHIDSTKKESERFETAWVYSRLEFRGENFEEVAEKMERWYNVTIVIKDEKVKQLRVRGQFEKETVEEAFAALKKAFPVIKYKINNHEISVESSN